MIKDTDPTEEPTILDGLTLDEELGIEREPEVEEEDESIPGDEGELDEAMSQVYIGALEQVDPNLANAVENMTDEDWDSLEKDHPEEYNNLMDYFDEVDEQFNQMFDDDEE